MKAVVLLSSVGLLLIISTGIDATCSSTGSGCLSAGSGACKGLPDGDYQSCSDCTSYHSCVGGYLYANRLCPDTNTGGLRGKLIWQQTTSRNKGICVYSSSSCTECVQQRRSNLIDALAVESRSSCDTGTASNTPCLKSNDDSCAVLRYGDFQACESCTVYHSCYDGIIYPNRPCPAGLVWVTEKLGIGHCDWSSSTCQKCP